jgi:dTDP-4-dehydrorhamnose reductase
MRRLLVTGGSGYLGAWLMQVAVTRGWDVRGTCFSQPGPEAGLLPLDLTQPEPVKRLLAKLRPDAIVHAACSNRDPANVAAIEPAARNLAGSAQALGARLVHISTDQVFDGEHAPYDDSSPLGPKSAYGRAKAEAEASVTNLCPAAAIVRPSLIWSLEPLDRQTRWLVDDMRRGARVILFTDEIRCPVHLHDLAGALLELAGRPELAGPLNVGGRQALNRWDFGARLLAALDLSRATNVVPGTVAGSGLQRPRNLTLRCTRAEHLLDARLRGVDEVLAAPPLRQPREGED